jgi:hypothetical protein
MIIINLFIKVILDLYYMSTVWPLAVKGNFLRGNVFLLGLWLVCFLHLIRELWPWPWFMVFCGVFFTLFFWPLANVYLCYTVGMSVLIIGYY